MNKYQPAKIALWAWNSWPATHKQQSVNREFSQSPPNSSANRHSGTFTIFMVFWPEMLTESCTTLTCERQGNIFQSFCYRIFLPSRRADFHFVTIVHSDTNVSHTVLKPPPQIKASSSDQVLSNGTQWYVFCVILGWWGENPTNLLLLLTSNKLCLPCPKNLGKAARGKTDKNKC